MIRGASLRGFVGLVEEPGGAVRDPGVRRYHETFGREICPNANTLEDSLDQYDSMVKEKTLADRCKADPRWLQILPSTELAPWKRFWPVVPTYAHGGIAYGEIAGGQG